MEKNDEKKKVDAEFIKSILSDPTFSKKKRITRITSNNKKIKEMLAGTTSKQNQANVLLAWNDEATKSVGLPTIKEARKELEKYCDILNGYYLNLTSVTDRLDLVAKFNYKSFSNVAKVITDTELSKIIQRINNLKLLCEYYKKFQRCSKNPVAISNLEELIILEVAYQRGYLLILKNNLDKFSDESFLLGLLLFDIPKDSNSELAILKRMENIIE